MKIVPEMLRPYGGRSRKYKFREWDDGQVRECDVMAEFGVNVVAFKSAFYKWARANNRCGRIAIVEGTTLQFVFTKKGRTK